MTFFYPCYFSITVAKISVRNHLNDEMLILAQDFIGISIHDGRYGSWQNSQVGRVCGKAVHMAAV